MPSTFPARKASANLAASHQIRSPLPTFSIPLQGAQALAQSALAIPTPNPASLRSLAEACRRVGALDEARLLLHRSNTVAGDGSDDRWARLQAILDGEEPLSGAQSAGETPQPFLRLLNFLPSSAHDRILEATNQRLGEVMSSEIHNPDYAGVDRTTRVSVVLKDAEELRTTIMPFIKAAVRDLRIPQRLGLPAPLGRYELQATCHADGAFFKAHADALPDSNYGRALSFVYYYFNPPKSFSGGSLRIFDSDLSRKRFNTELFSAVLPEQNSIVFFPSTVIHEVEPVTSEQTGLSGGRFTLNGWFHFQRP